MEVSINVMSLTIFVHKKFHEVGIVEWFRDPKFRSLSYPDGPLHRMTWEEFRSCGYDWVHQHFDRFATKFVREDQVRPILNAEEMRKYLKQQHAVRICRELSGELRLNPLGFRQYNLAGFESFDRDRWKIIPLDSSLEVFWQAFDSVLEDAP